MVEKHTSLRVERSHKGGKYKPVGALVENRSLLSGTKKTYSDDRIVPMNVQAGLSFTAIQFCLVFQFVLGIIGFLEVLNVIEVKPIIWFTLLTIISAILIIATGTQYGLIRSEASRRNVKNMSLMYNEPQFGWSLFITFVIFVLDHFAIFIWDYYRDDQTTVSSPNNSNGLYIQGVLNLFLYLDIIIALLSLVMIFVLRSANSRALSA